MIEAVPHCGQPLPQTFGLALPDRFVAAFIAEQGLFELRQHVIGHVNVLQNNAKPVSEFFLAEIRQVAFAAIPGAAVIDIAGLLQFRRHHAVVVGAAKQAAEGETVLPLLGLIVPAKNSLDLVKQLRADERPMGPAIELVFPEELALVERILQQPVDVAFGERSAEFRLENPPQLQERMLAGAVKFKQAPGERSLFGINLNRALQLVVPITQRRAARINPLFGLLAHSLADFLAQILDIVARNYDLDSVYQFGLGTCILADDLPLFGQVDFDFQIFERDAIAEIAIEPVGFLHNGHPAGRILLEETHHFAELFSPCGFRRFHVHEFAHNLEFMRLGIFPQQLELRGNGIPLTLLIFARNAGVNDGRSHASLAAGMVSPTMPSARFGVNGDFMSFCGICRIQRISLGGPVPFAKQQKKLAQQADFCWFEGFFPCGPLGTFGQRQFNMDLPNGHQRAFLISPGFEFCAAKTAQSRRREQKERREPLMPRQL